VKGSPSSFWGKLQRNRETNAIDGWHPLVDHCADVAACAEALLGLPTWRRRLSRIYGCDDLDEIVRARLAVLAALHDIGKYNLGFQAKGRPDLGVPAGHVKEALAAIGEDVLRSVEPLGDWGEGTGGLLASAICHHGRPYSIKEVSFEPVFWTPRGGLNPEAGVCALVAACREWFPLAFTPHESNLSEHAGFEHAYAGLVMLADWLGSDQRIFPFSSTASGDRMTFARAAAKQFFADSWLEIDDGRRADNRDQAAFARVADAKYEPRPAQAATLELPSTDGSSIAILEAETGSGKTEAALAHFVRLFSAGVVDGLYFALPTRTAAMQIHARVYAATRRAFTNPPPVVLAVPGYLRVDDVDGKTLPEFDVLWAEPDRDRFRHRAWAGEWPKRYLAGCVVVGTIDQVLLSSLRVRHAHLRATALLRQLLVVDEVHASDAYMTRILEDVLARHQKAGGHAMLLSATLGGEARARLLRPGERRTPPTLDEAVVAPYPLISYRGSSEFAAGVAQDDGQRVVTVEARPWLEDVDEQAATALAAARTGAAVLVVKNTVVDCVETQEALERAAAAHGAADVLFACADVIAPHHARFARADRKALDHALETRFGKERSGDGCVVIATQTVQQSLDLDADLLLTDLCPMDVLLQRIGRLHRHVRGRPAGFEAPRTIVIVPANRDLGALLTDTGKARHHHGLGTVYPDLRVLEATWRQVEEKPRWRIPEMSRVLVELSIHSAALQAVTPNGDARWQLHEQQILGGQRGASRQADLNLIEWARAYSETSFADGEHIPTRLGEGDRRVRFEQPFRSPFGTHVEDLVLPARWVRGVAPTEETATSVVRHDGATRFQFGGRTFVYDRHGLRRSTDESEDTDDDGS